MVQYMNYLGGNMNKIEIINERMNSGMLINLTGNETVKKPYDYPNDFDEYIQWICDDFFDKPNHAIYTDKLYEYDSDKYKKCSIKIWGNDELDFDNRTPIEIEKFLSLYFNKYKIILYFSNQIGIILNWQY